MTLEHRVLREMTQLHRRGLVDFLRLRFGDHVVAHTSKLAARALAPRLGATAHRHDEEGSFEGRDLGPCGPAELPYIVRRVQQTACDADEELETKYAELGGLDEPGIADCRGMSGLRRVTRASGASHRPSLRRQRS